MSISFICSLGLNLVRAASRTTSMAPTARPRGSTRAKEGVVESVEAFSEDGGWMDYMTIQ